MERVVAFVATALLACANNAHAFSLPFRLGIPTVSAAKPPAWPSQYKVSWDLAIPYIDKLQSTPLIYKYEAWQDTRNGRQKVSRDGTETTMENLDAGLQWQIYPRVDTLVCNCSEMGSGAGPTRRLLSNDNKRHLSLVMPDLTQKRWHFNGTVLLAKGRHAGTPANAWVWTVTDNYGYGEYHNVYTFLVNKAGAPLVMVMQGTNLYTDGHYDKYVLTFYDYQPGAVSDADFALPHICPAHAPNGTWHSEWRVGGIALMRSVLPNLHYGDQEYDAFVHAHGRRHRTGEEYAARWAMFRANKARIEAWNARPDRPHELGVNHMADWTDEEYRDIMTPHNTAHRPRLQADGVRVRMHQPHLPAHMLPAGVDWRGTPADSPVKDQAMEAALLVALPPIKQAAFGSIASLEAAYFRQTGQQLLLSEQQLLDCAWSTGNTGCLGGFQELAFNWVAQIDSLASEEAYPYKGVLDFCNAKAPPAVRFKEFSQVWVNATGGLTQEQAVMEAILTKGPMTVSVNAEYDDFKFYKAGLYDNPKCSPAFKKLDHAVIVSGYGQTEDGRGYWIVKNTWSALWGEAGYIRIARTPDHDCGIATQAIYTDWTLTGH